MRTRSTIVYLAIALAVALVYLYDIYSERKSQEALESAEQLFDISSESMDSLTLVTDEKTTIEIQKKKTPRGNRWWILRPISYPADARAVQALTDALASLRSMRTITENPQGLNPFGLQEPRLTIHFTSEETSGSLVVGDLLPTEDGYYVRTGDDTSVHIISDLDKDELNKGLDQLRRKRLFTIPLDDATRFVIARGTEVLRLVAESGRWRLEDDPAFPVDWQKVNSTVLRFARAEATSFVDGPPSADTSYGLTPPVLTVSISDGTITEKLLLGKPITNGDDWYAKMEGMSQVVTVPKDLVAAIPANREDLKAANEEEPGNP